MSLLCLGWNCVIGSGIFISQGEIAGAVGPYGPLLFLVGGLLCLPIALCFAQLAQRYSGMGGSALYAREVFGARAGFIVGWVMWLSGIIGLASVAAGFASVAGVAHPQAVAVSLVVGLALVNLVGTKGGAFSNNLLALVKLGPLLVAALVAPILVGPGAIVWPSHQPFPEAMQWKVGLLSVLYAYSGFEEIVLPAGEVRDAQRNVPRATVAVLLTSALLYFILQGFVSAQLVADSKTPLEAAALASQLPTLAIALFWAARVSLASVNASIAFTTPRSLWTLAQHGWLPTALLKLNRGAPSLCIVLSAALTCILILVEPLKGLIVLSVLAALLQHLAASLACWKLRGWASMPGIPQLSVMVCLLLLCTSDWQFLVGMAVSIAIGTAFTFLVTPKPAMLSAPEETGEIGFNPDPG